MLHSRNGSSSIRSGNLYPKHPQAGEPTLRPWPSRACASRSVSLQSFYMTSRHYGAVSSRQRDFVRVVFLSLQHVLYKHQTDALIIEFVICCMSYWVQVLWLISLAAAAMFRLLSAILPLATAICNASIPCVQLPHGVQMPMVALGSWRGSYKDCQNNNYSCAQEHARHAIQSWLQDIGGTHVDTVP